MSDAIFKVPAPVNEPIKSYAPGAAETESLKACYDRMASEQVDIPIIIGGKEIRTGKLGKCIMPHDHGHVLGQYHIAGAEHVAQAAEASKKAWAEWSEMPWEHRASVFLKASELLAGPFRDTLNAATMLGQSKTCFQAEIDAACELIDFFRFNVQYYTDIIREQPLVSPFPTWNRTEYRALEGFVFAITPFNFTSIAANLCFAPALMGNTVIWKPSDTAVYSGYYIMKLFEAAGLPPGVVNFVPGPPEEIAGAALAHPELAGVHFTGSTHVFRDIWKTIGNNIHNYHGYPRIVGETGGKDFIFAHESADIEAVRCAIIRGSFEFQGQKCSAASRAYIPNTMWPELSEMLKADVASIKMGDPRDFTNFMSAVIHDRSFAKISSYLEHANAASDANVITGGKGDDSKGYFIEPTIIETSNPNFKTMCEEIFGPVMTIHPYDPARFEETLAQCDSGSPYALTGAIFAQDRRVLVSMTDALKHSAGNFYINDKPTGAVVGQQPFGGGRASGTNDKAGSAQNLLRWTSVRSIKENFVPPTTYGYPHMANN